MSLAHCPGCGSDEPRLSGLCETCEPVPARAATHGAGCPCADHDTVRRIVAARDHEARRRRRYEVRA